MKIGYMTDTHGGPYDQPVPSAAETSQFCRALVDEATLADQVGFDGLFVPERHGRSETLWPSPLMALMAMAVATERVALGTCIIQPSLYNPVHLAEDSALVDCMSDGRLILGIGAGYNEAYFRHFGVPYQERFGRFREAVDLLRTAWLGQRFDWHGDYWQLRDVLINPVGVQPGGPPLWFAGTTERAVARAAREGDGLVLLGLPKPMSERRHLVDTYRLLAREHGRTPVVVQIVEAFAAESHDQARAQFGELLVDEIRYYIAHGMIALNPAIPSMDHIDYDHIAPHMAVGTPDQVIAGLETYQVGLALNSDDWIIVRSRLPRGPGFEAARRSQELFGSAILPAL